MVGNLLANPCVIFLHFVKGRIFITWKNSQKTHFSKNKNNTIIMNNISSNTSNYLQEAEDA